MSFTPNFFRAISLLAFAILPSVAMAQASDSVRLISAPPGKDGGNVGLAVIAGKQYQGSDERRTMVVPFLEYQWANGWFAGVRNGVGYNFSKDPSLQYGPRLTLDFGRKEDRSIALKGMGDIQAKVNLGAFLNYSLSPEFMLTSSIRTGGNRSGSVLDLGFSYTNKLNEQMRLSASAGVTWGNAEYMHTNFGVSSAQALRSGYRQYSPGAGVSETRLQLALTYKVAPQTNMIAAISSSMLSSEAKSSPIVRKANSVTGLLGVAYAF